MNSPAMQAFNLLNREYGTDSWTVSWIRLNRHLADAIYIAISGGLRFDVTDFGRFMSIGKGHIPDDAECYHAVAVNVGNKSAANSIDAYLGRRTLYIGKRFDWTPDRNMLRRAHVGCQIYLGGRHVTITSFSEDGESVTACAYRSHPNHRKVEKRLTLTRADLNPPKEVSS